MKSYKYLIIAIVLVACAVAIGLHILHKDAEAQPMTFTVYLHDGNDPITDAHCEVHITFYSNGNPVGGNRMNYQQTGIWIFPETPETTWTHWNAIIEDVPEWEVNGINPPGNNSPLMEIWGEGSQTFLDWEAELIPLP